MHTPFVADAFRDLIADDVVSTSDSLVAVAAGPNEAALFQSLGIADATITYDQIADIEDQLSSLADQWQVD